MQEHWATALKTLTLTLDEVVHIRSVLTKAELEGLPLDGDLKDDVAKGKVSGVLYCCYKLNCRKTRAIRVSVGDLIIAASNDSFQICFLCMKTRFGFFSWGVRCQLCKQQVCSKCSTKVMTGVTNSSHKEIDFFIS